jgi:Mg2+ and Co2+ transporter CorA
MSERINVSVRIRPLSTQESEAGETKVFTRVASADRSGALVAEEGASAAARFTHVFTEDATNAEVFDRVGARAVKRLMDGYNGTIFMYGQTGSGKTHTMTGVAEDAGLTGRVIECIYALISESPTRQFLVRGSYVELYNEKLYDLLHQRKRLELGLDPSGEEFRAVNRTETCAKDAAELDAVRIVGEAGKKMGVSKLNEHSSRSHAIFSIIVESTEKEAVPEAHSDNEEGKPPAGGGDGGGRGSGGVVRVSTLNLVDLAGSETFASNFGASQQRETVSINRSLSSLKDVIVALSKADQKFVPYRNSMLTKLLKSALGGNACTSVICCITPAAAHRKVTNYTLEFGKLASKIENLPKQNLTGSDDSQVLIKQYQIEIKKMSSKLLRLEELEKQTSEAQEEIARLKNLAACVVDGAALQPDDTLIVEMQAQLEDEKKAREDAMDSAVSRDQHVAETLLRNEREAQEHVDSMRLAFEEEIMAMRIDFEHEREALLNTSGRQDLREVVEQRKEIVKLTEALEVARNRSILLESMLSDAQSVITALTTSD